MVVLWLLDAALIVLGLVVGLFGFLDPLTLPAAPTITVPIPFVGASVVANLNTWFGTAVAVAVALAIGRMLQWLYDKFPYKGT